jgi:hypothetical protein
MIKNNLHVLILAKILAKYRILNLPVSMGVVLTIITTMSSADAQILFNAAGDAAGNVVGGTGGGGTGGWYASSWWNGTANQSWDGSTAVFGGAAGTATLEGEVDSGGNLIFLNNGHVINLNGHVLNFESPNAIQVNSGVTATIVGSGSTSRGLSQFNGGGNLVLGDGSALSGSQFGFSVFDKGGTVTVNNNISGSSAFNNYIQFNASNNHLPITLAGNGYVGSGGADLVADGGANMIISPGLAAGQIGGLKFDGTLTLNANGGNVLFNADIGGTAPGMYDTLITSGSLGTANGQTLINISLVNGYNPMVGDYFDLLQSSSISGTDAIVLGNMPAGVTFGESVVGGDLRLTVTTVPEPSSAALLVFALVPLLAGRVRRQIPQNRK